MVIVARLYGTPNVSIDPAQIASPDEFLLAALGIGILDESADGSALDERSPVADDTDDENRS